MKSIRAAHIVPLLFASGFCALIYQTVWLREFRLFFGASTAATSAVLAIFMGGLGFGGAVLGRRVESLENPLRYYARLELMIGLSAVATPALMALMRHIYIWLGGTLALGMPVGTIIRLSMSVIVLGIPTFLMGGTLPAVARASVTEEDVNRRPIALLYGTNTLGAVLGALASTFWFLEKWGNSLTLLITALLNIGVALAAFAIARRLPDITPSKRKSSEAQESSAPSLFVFIASAIAGFVFLLMEIVWYRMLCPLLGASTFTFGLILAVALFGIGLGGLIYAMCFGGRRITLATFALVSALEAICVAYPYALGDKVALLALLLRSLGVLGFGGYVTSWACVCAVVVLPAAIISGVQFPMLIALLGKGRAQVGSHTGLTYAWNTLGSIAGALAGGFGFLPLFSAPGVWRLVIVLLGALAITAALLDLVRRPHFVRPLPALGTAALALSLLAATGPTAFWRHSEIGVGRIPKFTGSKSEFHDLMNTVRRDILWDVDGVESSVALSKKGSFNFIVNGRCDGAIKADSDTQIMLGMVPAILHPAPTQALVVGLGTGSTTGWIASVPSIQQVDVLELEPAILKVAEACTSMNCDPLTNSKVRIHIGDAREMLLCLRNDYDLIVSEPSNPYRAGVANLFTREYYQAAASRLRAGGLFAQWVQAYEIDDKTMQTVYATFGSVFPSVETWQLQDGDLLLVGSATLRSYDAELIRERLSQEPFRKALSVTWQATTLEEFLAHFIADNSVAEKFEHIEKATLNTDDRSVLEFAFARNVDLRNGFKISTFRLLASLMRGDRPSISGGEVNWPAVNHARISMLLGLNERPDPKEYSSELLQPRVEAYAAYLAGNLKAAFAIWKTLQREPEGLAELLMVSECSANEGTAEAKNYIDQVRRVMPFEADVFTARLLYRTGQTDEAIKLIVRLLQDLRTNPWPSEELTERFLRLAEEMAQTSSNNEALQAIYEAFQEPFSAKSNDATRLAVLLHVGIKLDKNQPGKYTLAAIEPVEPNVPWQENFLKLRINCYRMYHNSRLAQAQRDLIQYEKEQPAQIRVSVPMGPAAASSQGSSENQ